jgi:hypothetical protein
VTETLKIDSLAVTMDDEPAWVAAALQDAVGMPRVPVVMRLKGGRVRRPSPLELAQLTATLDGITMLAGDARPDDALSSHTEVRTEAGTVKATVSLPDAAELAEPVVAVPSSPRPRATVGRNERCSCGSGRKYKSCHLGEDTARAATETRRLAERDPIHAFDERLVAQVLAHARARWGADFEPLAALRALHIDPAVMPTLVGWAAAQCLGPGGETALELFLSDRGQALDPDAGACRGSGGAWYSYLEVVSVEPGVSLVLRDLLSGRERTVQEVSASRMLVARDVVCATVLDLGDRCILGAAIEPAPAHGGGRCSADLGMSSVPVAPGSRSRSFARRPRSGSRSECGKRTSPPETGVHRPSSTTPTASRCSSPPTSSTSPRTAPRPSSRRCARCPAPSAMTTTRRDTARSSPSPAKTVRGTRCRAPSSGVPSPRSALRLESNSVARADRLRSRVGELLGDRVRFKGRSHADPLAAIGRMPSQVGGSTSLPPVPAELAEALRRTEAELARRWLEQPVPALGGLTPREAARRKGVVRKTLEVLLAERENFEARRPAGERFASGPSGASSGWTDSARSRGRWHLRR